MLAGYAIKRATVLAAVEKVYQAARMVRWHESAGQIGQTEPGPLSTPARLDGTVFVSSTRALYLYVGPLVATARHAHHAAQIVLAPHGVDVEDGANGRIRAWTAVGFADSAHLSRVFREQFGMTPTQGLSSIKWRTLH